MPNFASLFGDWLLEPLWALFGVDGDSLLGEVIGWAAGAVVSAVGAGLLVLLHLLWRAVCRYRDSRAIAKVRQGSPSSTLILVSDFAGKGGEAWGRNIIDRLQPDFEAFSGGSSARLHHWTERFASSDGGLRPTRFARAVARARTVLRKQRADLIIWGRYVGGDGLRLHVVSALGKAQRPDIALDFKIDGQARLTREMGDAIAFFSVQAANRAAELASMKGEVLSTVATKLHTLATHPPTGLNSDQIHVIENAFDSVGFAATQRAFPPPSVKTGRKHPAKAVLRRGVRFGQG